MACDNVLFEKLVAVSTNIVTTVTNLVTWTTRLVVFRPEPT